MFPVKHEQIFKNGIKCIHKVPFQNKCTDRSMEVQLPALLGNFDKLTNRTDRQNEGKTGPRRFIRWHRKVAVMIVVVVVAE